MSKPTPGPWKYRGTLRTYIVEPVSSSSHVQRVAVVSKDIFAESQFNARLIAAAPDMLAALEAICEHANEAWAALDHDYHEVLAGNLGDAVDQARAALTKAKGADNAATSTD